MGRGRSKAAIGGRNSSGGGGGGNEKPLYTEDKRGIRTYGRTEEAAKAFQALSDSYVHWNKGAYISKTRGELGTQVTRSQMWDYLNRRDINSFIIKVPLGQEKRALQALDDHGYKVVAKSGFNTDATEKHHEVDYYVSRKQMTYLTLDFKRKTYYKRGWKDI